MAHQLGPAAASAAANALSAAALLSARPPPGGDTHGSAAGGHQQHVQPPPLMPDLAGGLAGVRTIAPPAHHAPAGSATTATAQVRALNR